MAIVVSYKKLPSGLFVRVTEEILEADRIEKLEDRKETLLLQIRAKTMEESASVEAITEEIGLLKTAKSVVK